MTPSCIIPQNQHTCPGEAFEMLQPTDQHDKPACFKQYSNARRSHTIIPWVHDDYCEHVCAAAPPKLNKYIT